MKALKGLSEIADDFDGFILDLWGLIHDGVTAYPGVVETFKALKRANLATILLSNAPPAQSIARRRDVHHHLFCMIPEDSQ